MVGVAKLVEALSCPVDWRVVGLIPGQVVGLIPSGGAYEKATNQSFSLTSVFLSLFLSEINEKMSLEED